MRSKFPRRTVVRFLLSFTLLFGLLIAPWPGWNGLYGQYFRAFGNTAFNFGGGKRVVDFAPSKAGVAGLDTQLTLGNRDLLDAQGKGKLERTNIDSRSIGWVPTALTIALVAATPVPWRRRLPALAGALVLIHAFLFLTLQSWVWNNSPDVSLLTLSAFWKNVADELDYTLMNQLGTSFSVPVIIWILVTFKRQDKLA